MEQSFKPYKGVSSNQKYVKVPTWFFCFKPYKGVSSNFQTAPTATDGQ